MKKFLLTTAMIGLSTNSIAEEKFYIRADVGASFIPKEKIHRTKTKSSNHLVADLGVGAYISDIVRAELSLSNHFNIDQKSNKPFSNATIRANRTSINNATGQSSIKRKIKVTSLTAKILADFYDFNVGKIFAGVGLGVTKINSKTIFNRSYTSPGNNGSIARKSKQSSANLSYLITIGTTFDVSEYVKFDIAYSYNNYGKIDKSYLKSHDVTAGIRVSL